MLENSNKLILQHGIFSTMCKRPVYRKTVKTHLQFFFYQKNQLQVSYLWYMKTDTWYLEHCNFTLISLKKKSKYQKNSYDTHRYIRKPSIKPSLNIHIHIKRDLDNKNLWVFVEQSTFYHFYDKLIFNSIIHTEWHDLPYPLTECAFYGLLRKKTYQLLKDKLLCNSCRFTCKWCLSTKRNSDCDGLLMIKPVRSFLLRSLSSCFS